ncbi:MAG: hypothetical protein E7481_02330 [Ruminococcaceae bacterium]|nr:hypothetical protein [Oscillospiraceae bacterium]
MTIGETSMRIGLFSDSHYCMESALEETRLCSLSLNKIQEAMKYFSEHNADIVLCLGDMVDAGNDINANHKCLAEVVSLINASGIPFILATGNHDFKVAEKSLLQTLTGFELPPYIYDIGEYRIITLDANYESDMKHYSPDGFDWTDTNLPTEQLEFLRRALYSSDRECIIAIHEPISNDEDKRYPVNNAEEIKQIIKDSGKVRLVIQGHKHEYEDVTEDNIRYVTVVGMCEGIQNRFMILDIDKDNITPEVVII